MMRITFMKMLCLVAMAGWGAAGTADAATSVTGNVVFKGAAPAVKPVAFGGEQQCALMHSGHPPMIEDIVVNSNGTLRDVLVYISSEVAGSFTPPAEPLVYEQKGCLFLPHVGAVMAGQPVEVRNDDPVLHNVRAQSKQGQSFNIAQPVQGMTTIKVLKKPEIGIPLKCDVHFWMTGFLHVLAHPFFAVTGDDGSFTLSGLPAGTYTLEAWHGALGARQMTVTVEDHQPSTIEFAFGE